MKPYAAFSRQEGRAGGSILVIANIAKEARLLAWRSEECLNIDEWIDLAVVWMRDKGVLALADQDKTSGRRSARCCVATYL